ncbi:MAG: hypothetical protein ISS81_09880 [Candidatus Marinimicrobia bacterium]|nr:hypothetical protein [Candidatus Neomarinimicrobiota bacterium]
MKTETAKELLAAHAGTEDPVILPRSVLDSLCVTDIPPDTSIEIGTPGSKVIRLEWSGRLYADSGVIKAEAGSVWYRKYWYAPLGLEHYLDLVKRAIEVRQKHRGDVKLTHFDDDGAFIQMYYEIDSHESNLGKAFKVIEQISHELEEVAKQTSHTVGRQVSDVARRVSGWGTQPLDQLVEAVEKATSPDEKGRSLEELVSRLLETIDGFIIISRIRTETEEIDIEVLNDSSDARFKRESALLLVECKNWSSKCGKNEFVIFKEKIENRSARCSLGFLVSWNGFKATLTKEMLRGSKEETLIVPMIGKDIRAAVRDDNFADVLTGCWQKAVNT